MTPLITDRAARISTLVDSTFGLSLRELRSFLERECPNDPELRAEIERRIVERETTAGRRSAPDSASSSLAVGEVVAGRYTVTRLIGRGGMGEVYEAHDSIVKESVALKTLRADLTENTAFMKRFEDEIYLARKVTHRNVCRIYEIGIHYRVTSRRGAPGSDRRASVRVSPRPTPEWSCPCTPTPYQGPQHRSRSYCVLRGSGTRRRERAPPRRPRHPTRPSHARARSAPASGCGAIAP